MLGFNCPGAAALGEGWRPLLLTDVVSRSVLQNPVDFVLAGDVSVEGMGREADARALNLRTRTVVKAARVARFGPAPSFTVTTTKGR